MGAISTVVDRSGTTQYGADVKYDHSFISSPSMFTAQIGDPPVNEDIDLKYCVKMQNHKLNDGSVFTGEMKKVPNSKFLYKRHGEGHNVYISGNR